MVAASGARDASSNSIGILWKRKNKRKTKGQAM
jgi:hypothetical protein